MKWATYIGLPYEEYGRTREGVDCYGLVCLAYKERYGIELPEYSYGKTYLEHSEVIEGRKEEEWLPTTDPREGDIVLLRQFKLPSHVGILCDDQHFIHCEQTIGTVKQRLDSERWSKRIVSFFRHKALDKVRLVTCPSPLSVRREHMIVEPGTSVLEAVQLSVPEHWRQFAHVDVHGQPVPPEVWADTIIRPGAIVNVRVVPKGKGRNLLRTILSIAITVWATNFGPNIFRGWFGAAKDSVRIAFANVLGHLALNALVPPSVPRLEAASGTDSTNVYSISGAQNRANLYGAIPVILGEHRFFPPYAAKPYTMLNGDDQYLFCLFALGYGPLDISDLRIGETSLGDFSDVETRIYCGEDEEDDNTNELFPEAVHEEDLNIALTYEAGAQIRTTEEDVDQAVVDITFPRGLCHYSSNGGLANQTTAVNISYRPHSGGEWVNAVGNYIADLSIVDSGQYYYAGIYMLQFSGGGGSGAEARAYVSGRIIAVPNQSQCKIYRWTVLNNGNGYTSAPSVSLPPAAGGSGAVINAVLNPGYVFRAATSKPLRKSFTIELPGPGQYDIRVQRVVGDATSNQDVDEFFWTALRSIKHKELPISDKIPYKLAKIALKIKATDQLNGLIESFNCLVKSKCKKWSGSEWLDNETTNNPADLYRYLLQHPANAAAVADSRLDLTSLQNWAEFCDTKGYSFEAVFDSSGTLFDRLKTVAAAGRASCHVVNNRYGVIVDQEQSMPVQVFSPRNIKSFSASRSFVNLPHGFRCRFINRDNDYKQEEHIVYRSWDEYDVDNSTLFEQLELFGVTNSDQLHSLAWYHLAVAQNRQESFFIEVDAEHLVCTRGDLVRLIHDVPLIGSAYGRIAHCEDNWIRIDENCAMEDGKSYAVQVRKSDGSVAQWDLVTVPGDNLTLTRSGGAAFDCAAGDIFAFGESGSVTMDCLVQTIEHQADLCARLTLVPYSPLVYSADDQTIPTYDPQMTIPANLRVPNPPRSLAMNEFLYLDGGLVKQGVTLHWQHGDDTKFDHYEVQLYAPDGPGYLSVGQTTVPQFTINDLAPGTYSFRVSTVHGLRYSDWTELADQEVAELLKPPDDVTGLRLTYRGGAPVLTWNAVEDIRPIEYEVRLLRSGTNWESAVVTGVVTVPEFAATVKGSFLVKAKYQNVYSVNSAYVYVPFRTLGIDNVKEAKEEAPTWGGTLTGDLFPNPPIAGEYDAEWSVQQNDFDGVFDVDYTGSVKPDADGWTLDGTDYASTDGEVLTISDSGPCAYHRDISVSGDQWLIAEGRVRVESGDLASMWLYQHSVGSYGFITVEEDRLTINAEAEVMGDFSTLFRNIRVEQREGTRVYIDGELAAVLDGLTYSGSDSRVYFGRAQNLSVESQQHWTNVRYAVASNTEDLTPDGWSALGSPSLSAASGLSEYCTVGTVSATGDNGFERTPTMASNDVLMLQLSIYDLAGSNDVSLFVTLSNSASGKGLRVELTNGSVIARELVSPYSELASESHETHLATLLTIILWQDKYWVLMDRELVLSGTAGDDGAMGDSVRWGVSLVSALSDAVKVASASFVHSSSLPNGLGLMPGCSGTYSIASSDIVDLGHQAESFLDCFVVASTLAEYDLFLADDLFMEDDLLDGANEKLQAQFVEPQIRIHDGNDWDDWTALVPGSQYGQQYDFRLSLTAPEKDRLHVKTWHWEVDMPDRRESSTVTTSASGDLVLTFSPPFQEAPKVLGSILDSQAGDHLELTSVTTTGCTINVYNSGSRVARDVTLMLIGY